MLKFIFGLLLASNAYALPATEGSIYSPATTKTSHYLNGKLIIGASAASPATTITADGTGGVVTATEFVGGGIGLTGVLGTDSTKVLKTGDAMTGTLSITTATTIGTIAAVSLSTGNNANGVGYDSIVVNGVDNLVQTKGVSIGAASGYGIIKIYDPLGGQSGQLVGLSGQSSWIGTPMGFGMRTPTYSVDVASGVRIAGSGTALALPSGAVYVGGTSVGTGIKLQVDGGKAYMTGFPTALQVANGSKSGFGTNGLPNATVDVEGDIAWGLGSAKSTFTSAGYGTFLGDVTAARFFGDGSYLGGVLPLSGGYLTDALSIVSTNTSSHSTYPLTIGNLPGVDNVAIAFRSTDTTIPAIHATINNGAAGAKLNISYGLTTGGSEFIGNAGGITVNGTDGITNNYGHLTTSGTSIIQADSNALIVGGGARFGCGAGSVIPGCGVGLVGVDGKIPALSSTYLANLSAANLTGIDDVTKLPLSGGTMNGANLIFNTGDDHAGINRGNIMFTEANGYHSIMFKTTGAPDGYPLGQLQFIQQGTGLHRLISFDKLAVYPGQLVIGADISATAANGNRGIRITGNENQTPDIYVSTFQWVGIGTSTPAATLDVIGSAQFGSGAAKSTFTATGALNMASGAVITGNGSGLTALTGANVTGVVPTATALSVNPTACTGDNFVNDIAADGTLTCAATPAGARSKMYAANPAYNTTSANFSVCVASAPAITTVGGDVFISLTGSGYNATLGGGCGLFILRDGAFLTGESATQSIKLGNSMYVAGTSYWDLSFNNLDPTTPTAGSHTYCFGINLGNAGTGTCYLGLGSPVYFSVFEK